jgi:hypothetical protein
MIGLNQSLVENAYKNQTFPSTSTNHSFAIGDFTSVAKSFLQITDNWANDTLHPAIPSLKISTWIQNSGVEVVFGRRTTSTATSLARAVSRLFSE